MNKAEMNAAILRAAQSVTLDALLSDDIGAWDEAVFIAGMRAAAELPGNPNALQRDTIRKAADRLGAA